MFLNIFAFLHIMILWFFRSRDATQTRLMPCIMHVKLPVHLPVHVSLTLRHDDHIGLNTSEILSRLVSL